MTSDSTISHFNIVCNSQGSEGITKATLIEPGVIIYDTGLSGPDGFEVARQLRNNASTSSTLLIALTGYGEVEFINQAKEARFDHLMTKPASLADIQAALALTRQA